MAQVPAMLGGRTTYSNFVVPDQLFPNGRESYDAVLEQTTGYPTTPQMLQDKLFNAGRIDPYVNTARRKGGKMRGNPTNLIVDLDNRTLHPTNHPEYTNTAYTAWRIPGQFEDTRVAPRPEPKPYGL